MCLRNPVFRQLLKLLCLSQYLCCLRLGCHMSTVIVNCIALSSASLKISSQRSADTSYSQFRRLKSCLMMPQPGRAVSRAGNRHRCRLQSRIVRRREASVCRQRGNCGIRQIACHDIAQVIQFLLARRVCFDPLTCQQCLPAHPRCLSGKSFCSAPLSSGNGSSAAAYFGTLPQ